MTTLKQPTKTPQRDTQTQTGDDKQPSQTQQQDREVRQKSDREQSSQQESFTVSFDDFMMS